ncbi:MAG: HypC/HybG/HupF family hydrogenase formation chaperone [Planctomycetes bacterium]|nr:HypC/HybG/HupF family hydrogenase formation chaperone [Planctomycetota bacterium]
MCVAYPMQIVEIQGDRAIVDLAGTRREASVMLLDDAKPGDYVIVHAGFAIQKLSEDEARETLRAFDELARAMREEEDGGP